MLYRHFNTLIEYLATKYIFKSYSLDVSIYLKCISTKGKKLFKFNELSTYKNEF